MSKKVQKEKQRSTKHTHKTKDRVTRTPLKIKILTFPFNNNLAHAGSELQLDFLFQL